MSTLVLLLPPRNTRQKMLDNPADPCIMVHVELIKDIK